MTVCSIPSLLFLCYCDKNSWCVYLIELLYCPIQVTPLYIATDLLWVSAFPLPTASVLHSSLLFSFSFTPQHQHQHQQPATATANGILNCAVLYRTRLLKSECTILLLLLLPNVPRTACQNNIFSCTHHILSSSQKVQASSSQPLPRPPQLLNSLCNTQWKIYKTPQIIATYSSSVTLCIA